MLRSNEPLLAAAFRAWNAAAPFRAKRDRYKRFTYGDQWSDPVMGRDGVITAAENAIRHGRRPMTNNLLRRLVKSVIGRYRYRRDEEDSRSPTLRHLYNENCLDEIDCRALEEFLISGCTVQRVAYERRLRGTALWVDQVSPDSFFVNSLRDPRGWDAEMVGMIHEWSLPELLLRLGGDDPSRRKALREVYASIEDSGNRLPLVDLPGSSRFFTPVEGRCRVIEVWTLQSEELLRCHDPRDATIFTEKPNAAQRLSRSNATRSQRGEPSLSWHRDTVMRWHCRWLAPDGTVLLDHPSNAPDGSHPFHFRFYPMIDGEVHSLVEDVIDQQIYINELISLIDHVVGCAAKGVLLFPVTEKLPSMSWDDITRSWSSPDGIIPVRSGEKPPHQVSSSSADLGARELLATQMQMFEDISGVTNALMGRSSSGNIGAEHYESQVKNAIIAIADILDTFSNFISSRDKTLAAYK